MVSAVLLSPFVLSGQPEPQHNLHFDTLAKSWDEGLPLGNGTLGSLVWEKEGKLRLSLDRADVWDLRPMAGLHRDEFSFKWVQEQVRKKDYKPVQQYLDAPYDREPAPTKIPAGALEFRIPKGVTVKKAGVGLADATARVEWNNGTVLKTFVHATMPVGWFRFEGLGEDPAPELIAPKYAGQADSGAKSDPVGGEDLARLGYKQGTINRNANSITYNQEGWGGFRYEITVRWKKMGQGIIEGVWKCFFPFPKGSRSTCCQHTYPTSTERKLCSGPFQSFRVVDKILATIVYSGT